MAKKKRHIRWDRLILVILIAISLISLLGFGIYKLVKHFTVKPVEPGIELRTTVGPTHPSLEEFNKMIEELEKQKEPELVCIGEFRLTGYCPCEQCCGVWSGGPTYSGVMPTANHTIAVDTDVIPLGTHVWIKGQEFVAEDTGSAIIGNRIDIYYDCHEECFCEFCNGYADVYLEVE